MKKKIMGDEANPSMGERTNYLIKVALKEMHDLASLNLNSGTMKSLFSVYFRTEM